MRLIDADALKAEIQRRRKRYKTLTGVDMAMLIDDAPTIDGWISVKDRLPEEGVRVLVWEKHGSAYVAYVNKQVSGVWQIGDTNGAIITHWMPLPEPPEVEA